RCATASDARNLACGLRTTKRGAVVSSPFCISGLASTYALEPFFLRPAHRFFIKSDNRFLPAGVRRSPFFLLRVARLRTALVRAANCGEWPSRAAMARLSRSLSLFSSATILPVSKVLSSGSLSVQDFESASRRYLKRKAQHHLMSGLVLRLLGLRKLRCECYVGVCPPGGSQCHFSL